MLIQWNLEKIICRFCNEFQMIQQYAYLHIPVHTYTLCVGIYAYRVKVCVANCEGLVVALDYR